MKKRNIFKCKPPELHFTIRNRVPYNKQLTNRACSGRTGEYWPEVMAVLPIEHRTPNSFPGYLSFPSPPSHSREREGERPWKRGCKRHMIGTRKLHFRYQASEISSLSDFPCCDSIIDLFSFRLHNQCVCTVQHSSAQS